MADPKTQSHPGAKPKAPAPTKKPVRILMLHGYTQSGAVFRAKTRALEKLLAKTLAPSHLVPELVYPTGPHRLRPRDIPGWTPSEDGDDDPDATIHSFSWFRKDEASAAYRGLNEGMQTIAQAMREADAPAAKDGEVPAEGVNGSAEAAEGDDAPGRIDGVIGFSQGGCMASLLAAAMEGTPASKDSRRTPPSDGDSYDWAWVEAVRAANRGQPLKFAVVYSGFFATPADLGWLYEPALTTPSLHFLGSLDTVVEESRSQRLVDACAGAVTVVHPGGHYVPISKEWVMPLVGFIMKCVNGKP